MNVPGCRWLSASEFWGWQPAGTCWRTCLASCRPGLARLAHQKLRACGGLLQVSKAPRDMQRLGDSGAPGRAPGPAQRGGDAGALGRADSAEAGGPLTSPAPGFGAIAGRLEHAAHGSGTGSVNFGAPRAREGYMPAHGAASRLYGAEAAARGRAPGLAAGELDDGEYADELPRWNVPGRMASGHAGRGGGAAARGGRADGSLSLADWQQQGGGGGDYRSHGNYSASAAQHRAQDLAAHSGGAYEDADDDGRDQYLSLSQSPDAGASALKCCFTLPLSVLPAWQLVQQPVLRLRWVACPSNTRSLQQGQGT